MTGLTLRGVTVSTTVDDPEVCDRLVKAAIEERLAACVQVTRDIESSYRWEGRIVQSRESLILFKTTSDRVDALLERLRDLHSYDTPELLVTPVVGGDTDYLAWIAESTAPEHPAST